MASDLVVHCHTSGEGGGREGHRNVWDLAGIPPQSYSFPGVPPQVPRRPQLQVGRGQVGTPSRLTVLGLTPSGGMVVHYESKLSKGEPGIRATYKAC
jgi:hypothetical protein